MTGVLLRLIKFLIVPVILLGIGVGVVYYVVENPTDSMVARMLTYDFIITSLEKHLLMVFVSMLGAVAVGIPVGIMLSRPSFYYPGKVIENVVNVGQTVPSLAILALFFTALGLGFNTAVFALWLYSILPILRNTYAGIMSVRPEVIESAKGMGMSPWRILSRIEMPIAYPIIIAGLRTAIVINVGTATLATFIGAGGLGDMIVTGISVRREMVTFTGAALSAVLAILLDYIVGRIEKSLVRWS